jgi:hypothetical protein
MGLAGPARPRVSRETRLLLATILLSIAALWVLARLRFPERPVATSPVPPLLTQLTEPPGFDDLASRVSELAPRLLPSLVQVGGSTAVRVRDDVGVMLPAAAESVGVGDRTWLARDPVSGLALLSIPSAAAPDLTPWTTNDLDRSRYMIASDASLPGPSLRPVFIGRLHAVSNPAWSGQIWALPARTDVAPGDVLFTTDGALAGLAIVHAGAPALVPGETVLRVVESLIAGKGTVAGWLGIEVQAVPPLLTAGAEPIRGVIIAWIHPEGPAAGKLYVMDAIEAAGGDPIVTPDDWRARVARVPTGGSLVVRVRRGTEIVEVPLMAASGPPAAEPASLGLAMRTVRGTGADVLEVTDGSPAARAGIREGDLITAIGEIRTPTAQQVTRSFDAAPGDRALLVAITRGTVHRILALEKK